MTLHTDIPTLPGIVSDVPGEHPASREMPSPPFSDADTDYLSSEVAASTIHLPKTAAVTKLAEALVRNGLPVSVAGTIARSVTDPTAVRNRLSAVNTLRVRGAELFTVEATVFAPAVAPYLANPRAAGSWQFPAAGDGSLRPLCSIASADGSLAPELLIKADSPEHVAGILSTNAMVLTGSNNYRESIAEQGVLRPVILAVLTVSHADGTMPLSILTAVDGSSRITACHEILGLSSTSVFYSLGRSVKVLRREIERHTKVSGDDPTIEQKAALRALEVPATIIVGFRPSDPRVDFASAVRSLLGLIHVDPPQPWGTEGSLDMQADSVIATLLEEGLLNEGRARWFLGMMTPSETLEAGYPVLPDERFASIMSTLLDPQMKRSVNRGKVRLSGSAEKVTQRDRVAIAVELALRSIRHRLNPEKVVQVRAALNRSMELTGLVPQFKNELPLGGHWKVTGRSPDDLLAAALSELKSGSDWTSRHELAVLGAWWLTTKSALARSKHRGLDLREPSTLLRGLMSSEHGLRILHRALVDGRAGSDIAVVDEFGQVEKSASGGVRYLNNERLRDLIPVEDDDVPHDAQEVLDRVAKAAPPAERLRAASQALFSAARRLREAMRTLVEIQDTDGTKVADRFGIETDIVDKVKQDLDAVREDVTFYGRVSSKYRDTHRSKIEEFDR